MTITRWHRMGDDAVLLEFSDPADRWRIEVPQAIDSVVGARTVLVRFDPVEHSAASVVEAVTWTSGPASAGREHVIDVIYDGPDLTDLAERTGLSVAAVIQRHSVGVYTCEFCGFAPGFAYLSGLDPALTSPRRASPRPRVPAGSVAVAGDYTAVYPTASPGGWQLLGRTDTRLFDPVADPPALIRPGDTVRFRAVS